MEIWGRRRILERERLFTVWGKKGFNPYIKCSNKSTNQNKTRVQDFWQKNKSARAVCGIRPSGWFPRARFLGSQKSNLMPGWNGILVSGWIGFRGASGLRIKRNLGLNWMVFRYARNGVTLVSKFRGTQSQKSKTSNIVNKPKPTRGQNYFHASVNTPNHFWTLQ